MKTVSRLEISKTKSEPGTLVAFASLRFFGDRLDPHRLTEILDTAPTLAYCKGEVFKRSGGHEIRGRTGLWLASSEGRIHSKDLNEHLEYLLSIVFSGNADSKLKALHKLMREQAIAADATCLWYGDRGAPSPVIRDDVRERYARIPAEIEEDFDTD